MMSPIIINRHRKYQSKGRGNSKIVITGARKLLMDGRPNQIGINQIITIYKFRSTSQRQTKLKTNVLHLKKMSFKKIQCKQIRQMQLRRVMKRNRTNSLSLQMIRIAI